MRSLLAAAAVFVTVAVTATPAIADGTGTSSAPSQIVVYPMRKGDVAPYQGVLLTPEAVARIVSESDNCSARTQAEIDRVRSEERALADRKTSDQEARAARDAEVAAAREKYLSDSLTDVSQRLEASEKSRSNTALYVVGGFGAGVVVTLLTVVALRASL